MKKFKKLLSLSLILLFSFSFVSCSKTTPDESAQALFDLSIHGDLSAGDKLGLSKEEAETIVSQYKTASLGAMDIPEAQKEDTDKYATLLLKKLKDTSCRTELVSENGDTAVVKYYIKPLDFTSVMKSTMTRVTTEIDFATLLNDEDALSKQYMQIFLEELDKIQVLDKEVELEIEFVKEENIWVPKNKSDAQKIGEATLYMEGLEDLMN